MQRREFREGLRQRRATNSPSGRFWKGGRTRDHRLGYVYGAGLVSQVTSSESYYYLTDGLGSTMATVDSDGDVVNEYTYDVFGATRSESGAQDNEFQFAGQQVDGSTGLQYLRARYYDMETGRFMSREPLECSRMVERHSFGYTGCRPGKSDLTRIWY